jgi:DNA polymerase III subunit epsilon
MRQVVLDTETTGLEPQQGHRIIEIGCVEIIDRRHTGNRYHQYINPERDVDEGAVEVHGIALDDLVDKPVFADVVSAFLDFVRDSELIIHNAPFDVAFIDAELERLGGDWGCTADHCRVLDSLTLARQQHPGQRNSLDALCRRYGIDNSGRDLHGALLDAELLADVYLAMTGGQTSLGLTTAAAAAGNRPATVRRRGALPVIHASGAERDAHDQRLLAIEVAAGRCLWPRSWPQAVGHEAQSEE